MPAFQLQPLNTLTDDSGQPLARIEHDPAHQLLAVHWFGNLTGRQVIQVARSTIRPGAPGAPGAYRLLLNDKRQATGDWSEALDWLEYEWLPQALASGLHAVAYVFTPDMHNQLASYRFVERLNLHVHIEIFPDVPGALHWLAEIGTTPAVTGPGTA